MNILGLSHGSSNIGGLITSVHARAPLTRLVNDSLGSFGLISCKQRMERLGVRRCKCNLWRQPFSELLKLEQGAEAHNGCFVRCIVSRVPLEKEVGAVSSAWEQMTSAGTDGENNAREGTGAAHAVAFVVEKKTRLL